MEDWKQERPSWCPHPTCKFMIRSQDSLCIGKLAEIDVHDGVENTHTLCMRGAADDGLWLHSVRWNSGDAWNFRRIVNAAFGFNKRNGPGGFRD